MMNGAAHCRAKSEPARADSSFAFPQSSFPKTLVVGLGNPVVADDSVGLRVVEAVRPRLAGRPGVEVDEEYCGGLRLMERLIGFDRAVLVDAICSGAAPGTVRVFGADAFESRHCGSAHDVDLGTALALGRQCGARLPAIENIRIVAIEAADVLTFSPVCTPRVQAGIERAADAVVDLLTAWR